MSSIIGTFWLQPSSKFNLYISLGIGKIKIEMDNGESDGTGFSGSVGVLYFFNDYIEICNGQLDTNGKIYGWYTARESVEKIVEIR